MRCGVHVVTKIYRRGGVVRAYSTAIAVFTVFSAIFRLSATFTRPFGSSDRPQKLTETTQKREALRKLPTVVREKPREERAGHALRLVPRE